MADTGVEMEKQIAFFEDQLSRNPSSRVFAPLADLYRRSGDLERAQQVLEPGLLEHPNYIAGQIVLAYCQKDGARPNAARMTLEKVLGYDPENRLALNLLALDARRREDWREAVAYYERLVVADPGNEEIAEEMAVVIAMLPGHESVADQTPSEETQPEALSESVPDPETDTEPEMELESAPKAEPIAESIAESEPKAEPEPEPVDEQEEPIHEIEQEQSGLPEELSPVDDLPTQLATKTLAEIYLSQGYRERAVEVLQQILEQYPDRQDIRFKIEQIADRKIPALPAGIADAPGAPATGTEPTAREDLEQVTDLDTMLASHEPGDTRKSAGTRKSADTGELAFKRSSVMPQQRRGRFDNWLDRITEIDGDDE